MAWGTGKLGFSITIKNCGGGNQTRNFSKTFVTSLFILTALVLLSIEKVRQAVQGYKLQQDQRVNYLLCTVNLKLYETIKVELKTLVNEG